MITHIVMFKFAEEGALEKVKELLEALPEKIPVLRHLEVGVNVVDSPRSWDAVLVTRFDSLDDLRAYQEHPDHVEAAAYIRSVLETSASVDYQS